MPHAYFWNTRLNCSCFRIASSPKKRLELHGKQSLLLIFYDNVRPLLLRLHLKYGDDSKTCFARQHQYVSLATGNRAFPLSSHFVMSELVKHDQDAWITSKEIKRHLRIKGWLLFRIYCLEENCNNTFLESLHSHRIRSYLRKHQ